ncbi:MAG TPA: hypothetical protein VF469_09650 [Kofleriaceae bacterium]
MEQIGLHLRDGSGQIGAPIRAKNGSRTAIGPTDAWPQGLRTALSICLASRFPMIPRGIAVEADAARMTQVFANRLTHAAKDIGRPPREADQPRDARGVANSGECRASEMVLLPEALRAVKAPAHTLSEQSIPWNTEMPQPRWQGGTAP